MAVDMWSENSSTSSPRISFSHDLSLSDIVPTEHHQQRSQSHHHHPSRSSGLSSSFDFDFCPTDHEPLTADDFFCDGKILPTEIKKKTEHPSVSRKTEDSEKQSTDPVQISGPGSGSGSKSFWRFKRSTSCGTGYGRSLCPLPLLSRSNSTGSAPTVKSSVFTKEGKKNSLLKPPQMPYGGGYRKPPLRKTANPHVLNVPSGNLFGIGTVFFTGKEKNKRK